MPTSIRGLLNPQALLMAVLTTAIVLYIILRVEPARKLVGLPPVSGV